MKATSGLVHPAIAAIADAALRRLDEAGKAGDPSGPVAAAAQRATLERILETGGPAEVLLAARRFERFHEYPLFLVLLNSDSITLLLDKIARLNRYFHSHHRHRVLAEGGHRVKLEHVSISGAAPDPVESLFVAGLYVAVFERVGCAGLSCAFPASGEVGSSYSDGIATRVPTSGTSRWLLEWSEFTPRQTMPGIDDLILQKPGLDLEAGSVSQRVTYLVERDLSRHWRLVDIAGELMISPRTLQRRLQEERTSLTAIIADCRIAGACKLLSNTTNSVTDIGYMLGFCDTPHFTRTFAAAMGNPPSQWRDEAHSRA